jgi:predicted O-methyltransferase YrrM
MLKAEIVRLNNSVINSVDLTQHLSSVDKDFVKVFTADSGQEHYKLLAHLSNIWSPITILDVGTYKGYSALALASNRLNKVVSYDVNKQHQQVNRENLEYRIGDARDFENFADVKLILLDTAHDGVFERLFIDHLIKIKWSGLMLMDDIHHFDDLKLLWGELRLEKHDLTHVGHWSGTGLLCFD